MKYSSDLLSIFFWLVSIGIGLILVLISILKDILNYRNDKKIINFLPTIVSFAFMALCLALNLHVDSIFSKPTLLRVFYDGDINGVGIDFKTDGTYIFDNSSIGMSDYTHGKYTISGNKISLDKDQIKNFSGLKNLELVTENGQRYLSIGSNVKLNNTFRCRVVVDNR